MANTPTETLVWGMQHYIFALKVSFALHNGDYDYDVLKPEREIRFKNQGIRAIVPEWDGEFDAEQLEILTNGLLLSTFSIAVMAVDSALKKVFGDSSLKDWQKNPNPENSLREVIANIRNACAHGMDDLHWDIRGSRKNNRYEVITPDRIIVFDARNRHKTKLEFNDFGGINGFFSMVGFAQSLLSETPDK